VPAPFDRRSVHALAVVPLLASISTCAWNPATTAGGRCTGVRAADASDHFDEVQQKSVHNAYKKAEGLGEQLGRDDVRSLELDLHTKTFGAPTVGGDWYVHHVDVFDATTTCRRLSDCLDIVAGFHRRTPRHQVITVFLDLKDDLGSPGAGHGPDDLDRRIEAHFDASSVFRPADLAARCPTASTLRAAVDGCGWPQLGELEGKVAFVLTGGDACDEDDVLDRYVDGGRTARERLGFVAPTLGGACTIDDYADGAPHVLMVNMHAARCQQASAARARGLLARVWAVDDEPTWQAAAAAGANFLAVDDFAAGHTSCGQPAPRASAFARRDP
jgi:hypothetical protein